MTEPTHPSADEDGAPVLVVEETMLADGRRVARYRHGDGDRPEPTEAGAR